MNNWEKYTLVAIMVTAAGFAYVNNPPRTIPADLRDAVADSSTQAIDMLKTAAGERDMPMPKVPASTIKRHESGSSRTGTQARSPDCASELMQALYDAALPVANQGTVDGGLLATLGNEVDPKVLITGPAIFGAVADMIATARREANFQAFVWEDDSEAVQLIYSGIKRLEERRKAEAPDGSAPVIVRLLVDANSFGITSQSAGKILPIMRAGINALELDPAYVRVEFAAYTHRVLGNLHVKSLVVDGRYAIVMGANPEKAHNAAEPWFDTGYRFEGEMAAALRADFAGAWARSKHWVCSGARTTDCERDNLPLDPLEEDAAVRPVSGCRAVLVVSRKASRNPLRNKADNPADQAFLALFRNAEKVIRVQTPNLNDDAAKKALLDAMIRRGVEVNLILSKGFNEPAVNLPGQGGDNRKNVERLYKALREAGVADPCARLKARWYSFDGMTPVVGNGPRASHAKYTSADDALVVVGTSNMDTQSWNFSREVNIVVDDPQIALAWDRQVFIANFNRAIPVDECRQESQAQAQ